ncbi:hypothetical protein NM688_g8581 [Phlebia brevispora]|uniref:Uncharacterized protein n=1 Tax=Phlebia brevispora TaxID=194682 RepID=A0ACC1RRD2_9APHY|nr:hypothetical protein NM688_g8581 [Phlebia brevispora]
MKYVKGLPETQKTQLDIIQAEIDKATLTQKLELLTLRNSYVAEQLRDVVLASERAASTRDDEVRRREALKRRKEELRQKRERLEDQVEGLKTKARRHSE